MTQNVNVMNEREITNAAMEMGWVMFEYYKADGTRRKAIGTRNKALIESVLGRELKSNNTNNYYEKFNGYFDLTRMDWRQYNSDRFIGLLFHKLTNEQAVAESVKIAMSNVDCIKVINSIETAAERLSGISNAHKLVTESKQAWVDKNREWCIKHNNSRGLNGVLLAAASNGGSDCLGWVGGMGKTFADETEHSETEWHETKRSETTRKELIAELNRLRQRESEILAELLA